MSDDTFSYDYPHAEGRVPKDAARIVDETGTTWALSEVRVVPTGLYLWGRVDNPAEDWPYPKLFRTTIQIGRLYGMSQDAETSARLAETELFARQWRELGS